MNQNFPLQHIVVEETKEVLIVVNSAITAMGVGAIAKQYFPGYSPKIISKEYFLNKREELYLRKMSRFGDLIRGKSAPAPTPVVEEAPAPVVEEDSVVEEELVPVVEQTSAPTRSKKRRRN